MTDHVAVLHEILGNTPKDELHAYQRRALDHAIATCEQHAALVARLGELEKEIRRLAGNNNPKCHLRWADTLARVVKENTDG